MTRSILVAAAAAAIIGCDLGRESASPATAVVRDSAGVTIAEHTTSQVAELDVLVLDSPDVSIGALDGDSAQQLYRVFGIARLADGGIVLLNAGSHQVRFYDAAGALVRSVGRQGSGPGEFAVPVAMHRFAGDTVVVYDLGEQRWTWIAPNGETLRTLTAPHHMSGYSGFLDSTLVLLAAPDDRPRSREGMVEQPFVARIEDVAAGGVDTIGQFGSWQNLYSSRGEIVQMTQVPYTLYPVARPHDGETYILDGVSPEVRVYGSDTSLRRILRIDAPPRPVDRSEFDRYVDSQVADWRPPSGEPTRPEADQLRAIYNGMPLPTEQPFFDALVVARNGDVWLREFELLPGDHRTWTVLDSGGSAVARVRTPTAFTMREAGADYVLGIFRDEFDVEYVHLYRLAPPT